MRATLVDALAPWLGEGLAQLAVPGWFAMAAIAAVVTMMWLVARARAAGADVDAVLLTAKRAYVAAIVAGIAVPALHDLASQLLAGRPVHLRWAGMVSYCGFAGAGLAVWLGLRGHPTLSPARFADLAAAPAAFALFLLRLGCFSAGCDYGQVSASGLALRFPAGSPAHLAHVRAGWVPADWTTSLPVHPTQLYGAALGLVLCALALALARTTWARAAAGRVILTVVVAYAIGRFGIETLRGDAGRGVFGSISSAQLVAGALIGGLLARSLLRRRPRALAAATAVLALAAAAPAHAGRDLEVGGYVAGAAAINRRGGQVPAFGGVSLSASTAIVPALRLGLDADSLANRVASHGSLLVTADYRLPVAKDLEIGLRAGLGPTLVNFDDASFRDQWTIGGRAGIALHYRIAESWAVSARAVELDVISARRIGGPIATAQIRIGLSYRRGPATAP